MEFKFEAGSITVWLIPCLKDNYVFVVHESESNQTIVVDPADAEPVADFLQKYSLNLDEIWITHHHADHVGGVLKLKEKFSALVRGSLEIPGRIPGVTNAVTETSQWRAGPFAVSVLNLPGHTLDHCAYLLQDDRHSLLFSGDVLFGLGCGRLFEGTYEQMLASLQKIAALPPETRVFCSHEYTEVNLRFSLREAPAFTALIDRAEKIRDQRAQELPTVPLILAEELETNLFLRTLKSNHPLEEFRALRESRNLF